MTDGPREVEEKHMNDRDPRDIAALELVRQCEALEVENAKLLSILRAIRADRPTAHSDDVWAMICEATNDKAAGGLAQ